jgi:hypothetical protein
MTRTSKQEIINFFMHLCNDLGKRICLNAREVTALKKWGSEYWKAGCPVVSYGTVGAWQLDYTPCYGGWNIQEFVNEQGGIRHPLGSRRYKSAQFLDMICFARDALFVKTMENSNGL